MKMQPEDHRPLPRQHKYVKKWVTNPNGLTIVCSMYMSWLSPCLYFRLFHAEKKKNATAIICA